MIEGITEPFEPGRAPLTSAEQKAARQAFNEGLTAVHAHFGEGDLDIEAVQEQTGAEISFWLKADWGLMHAYTPEVASHTYGVGTDGVLRRSDSRSLDIAFSQPKEERFPGTAYDRFKQEIQVMDAECEAGLNDQPVGAKEVKALFALIMRGTINPTNYDEFL